MNKVENINVGGVPFIIDEDAYLKLRDYLKAVESYFSSSSGKKEIMQDIEIRIAELFHELKKGRKIVDMKILDRVIARLGTPEQFDMEAEYPGSDATSDETLHSQNAHYASADADDTYTVGRKLFRDPDDKIISGVASGLAAYFGIENAIWVRIIFVIMIFGGLSGGVLYILLWILIPEAETAADKLAMRGKDINISSIGNKIEEELSEIGRKFEEMSSGWKS